MQGQLAKQIINAMASTQAVLHLKPMMGSYVWLVDEHFLLPETGRALVSFEAQAQNDIHISFNKDTSRIEGRDGMTDRSPNYEIVIGGWMNRKTAIRKHGQQQAVARIEVTPNAVITTNQFSPYWVLLDNGLIVLGKGEPGTNEILRWRDNNHEFSQLKYVGFSSWDRPIQYRHVVVSARIPVLCVPLSLPSSLSSLLSPLSFSSGVGALLGSTTFSDLTISVGPHPSRTFYAHRCIVACRCSKLQDILQRSPGHNSHLQHIDLPDVNDKDFEVLLEFLYKEKVQVDDIERLSSIAEFADQWSPRLASHCRSLMEPTSLHRPLSTPFLPDFSQLLQNEQYHDVVFIFSSQDSKEEHVVAHRAILGTASEPLGAMLGAGHTLLRESCTKQIPVHEVDVHAFRLLLECVYRRRMAAVNSLLEDALPLLIAGDRFDLLNNFPLLDAEGQSLVCSLLEHLTNYIRSHMTVKTACYVLQVAHMLQLPGLRHLAMQFIENNFDMVSMTKSFLGLEEELVLEILVKDSLVVADEERVFEALIRWIQHTDPTLPHTQEEREEVGRQLLSLVRYPLMEAEYIHSHVLKHPIVANSLSLQDIINDSLTCHHSVLSSSPPGRGVAFGHSALNVSTSPSTSSLAASRTSSVAVIDGQVHVPVGDLLTRPRASRSFLRWKELSFSGVAGDQSGLFYYLGKQAAGSSGTWVNPARAGKVTVTNSTPARGSRYGQPHTILDRAFHTTWYTTGRPWGWMMFDFGDDHPLALMSYTLRHDGSRSYLRSWTLQGSNDRLHWSDLSEHKGDVSLSSPGQWAAFHVGCTVPYTCFRLMMTGPSASPESANQLALSSIEFYGFYKE